MRTSRPAVLPASFLLAACLFATAHREAWGQELSAEEREARIRRVESFDDVERFIEAAQELFALQNPLPDDDDRQRFSQAIGRRAESLLVGGAATETTRAQLQTWAEQGMLLDLRLASDAADAARFVNLGETKLPIAQAILTAEGAAVVESMRRERAKRLALNLYMTGELSDDVRTALIEWGRPALTEDETALLARLAAGDVSGASELTFADLVREANMTSMLEDVVEATRTRTALVADWLAAHPPATLGDDELLWCFSRLRPVVVSDDGVTIRWSGQLAAPQSGEYVVSLSPVNSSFEAGGLSHRIWMTVALGGNRIIDASPEAWNFESAPVALQEGAPTPIVVELRYERKLAYHENLPTALYWKRPGQSRVAVPEGAFSHQAGPGLMAEYRWRRNGQERVENLVEANLDFVRAEPGTACPERPALAATAAEMIARFTQASVAENVLANAPAEFTDDPGGNHPFLGGGALRPFGWWNYALSYASSAERARALAWLAEHPELLERTWRVKPVRELYVAARMGAEDEALDLVGAWTTAHAGMPSRFAGDRDAFFAENRVDFRDLGQRLAIEHPGSLEKIADQRLELPDGRCSLPAAYALAYGHLVTGRIDEWVGLLDARLGDPAVVGDVRVSWLIARAMTAEAYDSSRLAHSQTLEELHKGLPWLTEAELVAESEAAAFQVAGEQLVRLAAMHDWTRWDERLERAQSQFESDPLKAAALNQWRAAAEEVKAALAKRPAEREAIARQAYVAELKRRLQEARDGGDADAAARYAELVERFGAFE